MFEQNFRNSYKKYFLARTISKLAQFAPFASINIPSKRELLLMSAKFLPLYCASMYKSSLVIPSPNNKIMKMATELYMNIFNYSILNEKHRQ